METCTFDIHHKLEKKYWWFKARRKIIYSLINKLQDNSATEDNIILDIGCGTGGTVAYLPEHYNGVGIDASEVAIQHAQSKFPRKTFIHGSVPDDIIDLAPKISIYLLMDVLEHIKEDYKFMQKLINTARPGAYILITVPAQKTLWGKHDITAHHYRRYEIDTLSAVWKDLSVNIKMLTPLNVRLYYIIYLVRKIKNFFGLFFNHNHNGKTDFIELPNLLNDLLYGIFSGEKKRILAQLKHHGFNSKRKGVSLLAVLQKHSD